MKRTIYLDIDIDYFVSPIQKKFINGIRLYKDKQCHFGDCAVMLTTATSPKFIPSSADILINKINEIIGFSSDNVKSVKNMYNSMLSICAEEIEKARLLPGVIDA